MTAIGFAVASLVFASFLDIIFKQYSSADRSRGMFVAGMGTVWGLLQLTVITAEGTSPDWSYLTLIYGLVAGIAITGSNILLIESLTHITVRVGSPIYRLNTVGVVLLSFLFLHESPGFLKILAIGFGLGAAITLYGGDLNDKKIHYVKTFFWIAVLASFLRACFGVVSKAGLSAGADQQSMLLIAAGCWVTGGLAYAQWRERRLHVNRDMMAYMTVGGFVVFCIANTLFRALETGDASTVIPVANLSFVGALLLSVALKMEYFSIRKIVAVLLAVICIFMMAMSVSMTHTS